jgi:hypothetical protein
MGAIPGRPLMSAKHSWREWEGNFMGGITKMGQPGWLS